MPEPTPTAALKSAQTVADQLAEKRAAAEQRRGKIAAERASLSYAAHGEGSPKARKRLAELDGERRDVDRELEDLAVATGEARRRVALAEDAVATEQTAALQQQVREIGTRLAAEAGEVDAGFEKSAAAITKVRATARELTKLVDDLRAAGVRVAFNARSLEISIGRAHSSKLWQPLKGISDIALMAPPMRRPLIEMIAPVIATLQDAGAGAAKSAPVVRPHRDVEETAILSEAARGSREEQEATLQ